MRYGILLALWSGGCAASANFSAFGHSGSGAGGQGGSAGPGVATAPNVVLMSRRDAEAALRAAGFTAPIELDRAACGSTVDNKTVVELGHVCYQMPAAGRQGSTKIAVTLRVQHEDPWRGVHPSGRRWFLMPNFAGVSLEAARARLRELGFDKEPKVSYVQEPGCRPNVVCGSSPEPLARADEGSDKILVVGMPPGGAPSAQPAPTTSPAPPRPTSTPAPADAPPLPSKPADIF